MCVERLQNVLLEAECLIPQMAVLGSTALKCTSRTFVFSRESTILHFPSSEQYRLDTTVRASSFLLPALSGLIVAACSTNPSDPDASTSYYPKVKGREWVYKTNYVGLETLVLSQQQDTVVDGRSFVKVMYGEYAEGMWGIAGWHGDTVYYLGEIDSGRDPYPMIHGNVYRGDSWVYEQQTKYDSSTSIHRITVIATDTTISTSTTTYRDVVVTVRTHESPPNNRNRDTLDRSFFAKGVGLV